MPKLRRSSNPKSFRVFEVVKQALDARPPANMPLALSGFGVGPFFGVVVEPWAQPSACRALVGDVGGLFGHHLCDLAVVVGPACSLHGGTLADLVGRAYLGLDGCL